MSKRNWQKKVGLSQAIISQYEKGLTEIPLSFLEYLKKKHRISSDWLIFGTGEINGAIEENLGGQRDEFLKLIKQTQKVLVSADNDLRKFEKNLTGRK